jgi:AcrR family transcriptional regulator
MTDTDDAHTMIGSALNDTLDGKVYINDSTEPLRDDFCPETPVGAFYHYFKSKNDIFFEIYQEADRYFEEHVAVELQAPPGLPRILEYFAHYAGYCQRVGLDTVKSLYNPDNKLFIKYDRFMLQLLKQVVSDAQTRQLLSTTLDAQQITEYLLIAARGIVCDWCLHDGHYDLNDAMQRYITRLLPIFMPSTAS